MSTEDFTFPFLLRMFPHMSDPFPPFGVDILYRTLNFNTVNLALETIQCKAISTLVEKTEFRGDRKQYLELP